ncbi:MAG: DNA/RNA helicase domain-containing protein [Patescibacteria group bacterium]|mgnify:CR=1 FL=1
MLIYKSDGTTFINNVRENKLTGLMVDSFKSSFGREPGQPEINSWRNSLPKIKDLIEIADIENINIALEYEVPYNTGRIDCLLFGKDEKNIDNIVLIELKQWTSVKDLEDEGNFVETYTGGNTRIVSHPSQQIKGYEGYLKSFVAEFENKEPLFLFSCAYCHNYLKTGNEGLFAPIYEELIKDYPIYTENDTVFLAEKIKKLLAKGDGFEVFNRFMQSPITPSKKLLESVSKIISNEAVFSLLNEQLVAKNIIWSKINKTQKGDKKAVIIVHGGPGTGKSVIALNILAESAKRRLKAFYACKSKPFVSGLTNLVGKEAEKLISNLNRFIPSKVKENEGDIVLIDEAHRIGKTSNNQFTKKDDRTDMPQIDQIIRFAKTSVFFIDDMQNIRSLEIGSADLIRETAKMFGCSIDEITLETQFRCMGSNDYLKWLESTLGYDQEEKILSETEKFDFKIFNSPKELYDALLKKEEQGKKENPGKGNFARLVAGFCWPWSQKLDSNGELVRDVVIGDFSMPWETHDKIKPPKGYAKWYEWAYKNEGIKQVGCIYTAQGFEFDYIGVIVGDDLIYNPKTNRLEGNILATADPMLKRNRENFEKHVKNIYRVLMTRGMKGCYVYFVDKETEKFFKSRIENMVSIDKFIAKEIVSPYTPEMISLPLLGMAPCGNPFLGQENIEEYIDVEKSKIKKGYSYYVLRAVGDSMNLAGINDGDLVLCRQQLKAETGDKVVALLGDNVTIKMYDKKEGRRILLPKSTNKNHKPIIPEEGDSVQGVVQEVLDNDSSKK